MRTFPMPSRRRGLRGLAAALIALPMGCASSPPPSPAVEEVIPAGPSEYRIVPGDMLEIKSLTDGELNDAARVAPDGTIAHPMVGYIQAAGLTPEELDEELTRKLSEIVRNPSITVLVREYGGSLAFVGGEVFSPQRIALSGQTTALSAILTAGGYTPEGDLSRVVLIRRGPDGKPVSRMFDLQHLAEGGAGAVDPVLTSSDIVIVPPTVVTEANRFVAQYITRMIPGTLSATFNYTRGVQTFE